LAVLSPWKKRIGDLEAEERAKDLAMAAR